MPVPLPSLANPTHTPQKKCPSHPTSQPRKRAVPSQKSHTEFPFSREQERRQCLSNGVSLHCFLTSSATCLRRLHSTAAFFLSLFPSSKQYMGTAVTRQSETHLFLHLTCLSQPVRVISATSSSVWPHEIKSGLKTNKHKQTNKLQGDFELGSIPGQSLPCLPPPTAQSLGAWGWKFA